MDFLDPIFILILIFGSVTSYIDIKYGKIKNISVILLLIVGLFVNIFLTKTLYTPSLDPSSYFFQTITNFIISTILGFSLWFAGVFSEGDAKLFMGVSLLLPVSLYKYGYISLFPAVAILINTVIPIAIFFILKGLVNIKGEQIKSLKNIFNSKNFITNIIFLFGFSFLLQNIFYNLGFGVNLFLQMFILFILMEVLNKYIKQNILALSIIVSLIVIIFFYTIIFSVQFIVQFLILAVLFQILVIIVYAIDFSFGKEVKINQLKPGMVVGDKLVRVKDGYIMYKTPFLSLFDIFHSIRDNYSENLIRKLSKQGRL